MNFMIDGLSVAEELWLYMCNMALLESALRAMRVIFCFTWLSNQFAPSKFTINWVRYEFELSEKPVLMALHRLWHFNLACLFAKLSYILNLCFLSCCSSFSLFCIVGSGYSALEDDEDVYARNRYKGECFAYMLKRISWLLRESFFLFLFMDSKILEIQLHAFSHGFLDQVLISPPFNSGN